MFRKIPATGKVTLATIFADYAMSKALKSGAITSDLVTLDFQGDKVANRNFKAMVREGRFDAGELAIVTFLQAVAYGKPLVLLPAAVVSRFQHSSISYDCTKGDLTPKQIEGKRVGVRAYSQTTGVWVRGLLAHEYGVDISKVRWATYEEPHVAECKEPAFLERFDPKGSSMEELMLAGDFDAIIAGPVISDEPRMKALFPDPKNAALDWHRRTGAVTINHVFVVSDEVAKRPDVVAEIWRMLKETKAAMPPSANGIDMYPFGWEENRKNIELIIQYAYEQQMLPRMMSVDELIHPVTRDLKP